MAITQGTHHVGLTVPDINATRDFFVVACRFQPDNIPTLSL